VKKLEDAGARPIPVITVVIPAYQVAPYIAETLNSVFSQTLTEFEVIVVNDGSPDTDELERALAPYRERIRYVRQDNRGASAARNRGVQEAHGRFVAFLDGDDVWMPDFLEKQLEFVREGGYDLAYTDARLFGDPAMAGKTYMQTAPSRGPVTFVSLIRNHCNVITSGVFARRLALIEAGLFDERLRNAQDFELWTRLARGGARLGYQRKVLLRYRCRGDGLSGHMMNRLAREMRVYRHIVDNYDLTPAEHAELARGMKLQEAAIELAKGKLRLLSGRFDESRTSFKRAYRVLGGWKLRAAILMMRVAPHLLRRLISGYLRSHS